MLPQVAEDSALRAAALSRRLLPSALVRIVPGFAALRVITVVLSALFCLASAVALFAVPAAAAGATLAFHLVELSLQLLVSTSNPGLCDPQTVVVSASGKASVAAARSARQLSDEEAGGGGAEITHVRWPLRSQEDPSGRHLRRDGTPAHVSLFHRFDPFTANCVGVANVFAFTGLQLAWAADALSLLAFSLSSWAVTQGVWLGLAVGLVMLVAAAQAVFVLARLLRHLKALSRNLTAYEEANARRIVYLRGPGGGRVNPFRRGSLAANLLEALGLQGSGAHHDWRTGHVYSVAELPGHPLRPILVAKMRELHDKARAAGPDSLTPQQRLALALAELELPEALAPSRTAAPQPVAPAPAAAEPAP